MSRAIIATSFPNPYRLKPKVCTGPAAHEAGHYRAPEILMLIGIDQLRSFRPPLRGHVALADQALFLDLEDIGKIAPRRQLQGEAHSLHAEIVQFVILVKAVAH